MLAYLSLGANLGNREETIEKAIYLLTQYVGTLKQRSSLCYSHPMGFTSTNDFCNICVCIETTLEPLDLLDKCEYIERLLGRTSKSHNGYYTDRVIDIDIILYDDLTLCSSRLTLPHPRYRERDFVMVPLRQILSNGV